MPSLSSCQPSRPACPARPQPPTVCALLRPAALRCAEQELFRLNLLKGAASVFGAKTLMGRAMFR